MARLKTRCAAPSLPGLAKRDNNGYGFAMVIQSIREFNHATPFRPYEIRMASGQRYIVPHSDFATVSPKGSFVIVFGKDERPHHLSTLLIESTSLLNGHRRGKAAKH
jgi:hypothetical protein